MPTFLILESQTVAVHYLVTADTEQQARDIYNGDADGAVTEHKREVIDFSLETIDEE